MLKNRSYERSKDFTLVGDFLVRHYQPDNRDGNWLQPTWEYMHSHPYLDESALDKIRIWEDSSEIVGVVHYESKLGEVFFETHPKYSSLKPEMLAYAEKHLRGITAGGEHFVKAYVNDFDREFVEHIQSRDYKRAPEHDRPMAQFKIPNPFPEVSVPAGFQVKSLADDNDFFKTSAVLWRGFGHQGEPPKEGIEDRKKMQSVPNFRKDLNIVVEGPEGNFVAYAGTWFDPLNRIAYVEPVATDPDYRGRGLGKVAVLEGIRRCGEEGATVAYVGSAQKFYLAIGFKQIYNSNCWKKIVK